MITGEKKNLYPSISQQPSNNQCHGNATTNEDSKLANRNQDIQSNGGSVHSYQELIKAPHRILVCHKMTPSNKESLFGQIEKKVSNLTQSNDDAPKSTTDNSIVTCIVDSSKPYSEQSETNKPLQETTSTTSEIKRTSEIQKPSKIEKNSENKNTSEIERNSEIEIPSEDKKPSEIDKPNEIEKTPNVQPQANVSPKAIKCSSKILVRKKKTIGRQSKNKLHSSSRLASNITSKRSSNSERCQPCSLTGHRNNKFSISADHKVCPENLRKKLTVIEHNMFRQMKHGAVKGRCTMNNTQPKSNCQRDRHASASVHSGAKIHMQTSKKSTASSVTSFNKRASYIGQRQNNFKCPQSSTSARQRTKEDKNPTNKEKKKKHESSSTRLPVNLTTPIIYEKTQKKHENLKSLQEKQSSSPTSSDESSENKISLSSLVPLRTAKRSSIPFSKAMPPQLSSQQNSKHSFDQNRNETKNKTKKDEYKLGTEIQNQKTKPDAVKDGLEKKPVINQIKHNTYETPMVQRALPNRSTTAPNKTKSLSAIYNAQSLNAPNNQQTYTNCREDIADQEILTDEPDSAYATLKKRRLQMSSWHNANPENQDISSEIIPPEVPVKNYNRI